MNAKLLKLSEINEPVSTLQVLVDEIQLTTLPSGGLRVSFDLHQDLLVIRNATDKLTAAAAINVDEGRAFEAHCLKMRTQPVGTKTQTRFEKFFLRHASAGVLALLTSEAQHSPVLFERDIAPLGWNIANGGSSTVAELGEIESLLLREAGEELLFLDAQEKSIHCLRQSEVCGELALAFDLWQARFSATRGLDLEWSFQTSEDELSVRLLSGEVATTSGLCISLNAQDFGIECGRFLVIAGSESLIPIDGEIIGGRLLDRQVGIFGSTSDAQTGRPQQLFQAGMKKAASENRTTALCPVTEKMLARLSASTRRET